MIFNYTAKDVSGALRKGVVEAANPLEASDTLHKNKLTIVSLKPQSEGIKIEKLLPFLGHVPQKEMVLFSRQLATLINAKVPILQALDILTSQVTNPVLKKTIESISADIESGKSLSQSIAQYPRIFSNLYLNMVRAGELSGTLDQSLVYLADQLEKDYELVSKIRGALTYPIFIVSAIIIVGALMFVFVLPQMIAVLLESGAELPLTTRILIFITEAIRSYWAYIIFGGIAVIGGLFAYTRSAGGRLVWDALKLKIPILGKLFVSIYMDRLSRNLSSMVSGGIPIVQSLHTIADIVGNAIYRQIILEAAAEVETGKSIAAVFATRDEIPKIVTQMVRVGEQTGSLDEIMGKLATFYDKEVERTINTLTTLLEPIIMLLLGAAVAVMVAGVIMPIYNLASIQ